jgi:hypothetical protein
MTAAFLAFATIPVTQRVTFTFQGTASAAGPSGCSEGTLGAQSFPTGKTVYVSWTTAPPTSVQVYVYSTENRSGFLLGPGPGSFDSLGGDYSFSVVNCETHDALIAISAYYNFQAPAFWRRS